MSEKLTPHHLARRAIVYVRQSSHHQLVHNTESQRRQYAMEQRVRGLGWQETEVIDEDQGRSAASTYGRTGCQRMVAEVCLGRIGAVAVTSLRTYRRIPVYSPDTQQADGWMHLTAAAAHLGIASKTLRLEAERGAVHAIHPLRDGPWVLNRRDLDEPTFRERLRNRPSGQTPPAGPSVDQLRRCK